MHSGQCPVPKSGEVQLGAKHVGLAFGLAQPYHPLNIDVLPAPLHGAEPPVSLNREELLRVCGRAPASRAPQDTEGHCCIERLETLFLRNFWTAQHRRPSVRRPLISASVKPVLSMWHPSATRTCTQVEFHLLIQKNGSLVHCRRNTRQNFQTVRIEEQFFTKKVSSILGSFLRFSNRACDKEYVVGPHHVGGIVTMTCFSKSLSHGSITLMIAVGASAHVLRQTGKCRQ